MGVIKKGEESTSQEIFVVTGARQALLGRPAIEALNIVQKVNAVEANEFNAKFPTLFKGLGKLVGPDYTIKLKPDETPCNRYTKKSTCSTSFESQGRTLTDGTKWIS